jgi:hypothetical protein
MKIIFSIFNLYSIDRMNLKIQHSNRIGNFLIQIKNSIHIALYYNYNVILPVHTLLNTTYIVINKDVTLDNKIIIDKYNFYYRDKIKNINKSLFTINADKVLIILKDIFKIKNISPLKNDELVIHIRSGDIFTSKPHPGYIIPPLSYYKNIIEQKKYKNIYLLAEDRLNPCIDQLIKLYPTIIFKLQSLEEDIKIILAARNIVISYGTFITSILIHSDNTENVYVPSYLNYNNHEDTIPDCTMHVTDLEKYHKMMLPWKNTVEQREKMLTYQ